MILMKNAAGKWQNHASSVPDENAFSPAAHTTYSYAINK